MRKRNEGAGWRATATAALLLVTGGVMGVLVDRLWLSPPEVHASSLTPEAMAARLGLSTAEEAHLRSLLDTLHAEIHGVVRQHPDSLGTVVRHAQLRIEAALPPRARSNFRAWMQEHHDQVVGAMHGGTMEHGTTHGRGAGGAPGADQHHR